LPSITLATLPSLATTDVTFSLVTRNFYHTDLILLRAN